MDYERVFDLIMLTIIGISGIGLALMIAAAGIYFVRMALS